ALTICIPCSTGFPCHLNSFPTRRSSDLVGLHLARVQAAPRQWPRVTSCLADSEAAFPWRDHPEVTLRRRVRSRRSRRAEGTPGRSEEHTSELQSREKLVCRLLLEVRKYL